jgi:hypothetical protein
MTPTFFLVGVPRTRRPRPTTKGSSQAFNQIRTRTGKVSSIEHSSEVPTRWQMATYRIGSSVIIEILGRGCTLCNALRQNKTLSTTIGRQLLPLWTWIRLIHRWLKAEASDSLAAVPSCDFLDVSICRHFWTRQSLVFHSPPPYFPSVPSPKTCSPIQML